MKLGAHVSTAGGLGKAIGRAQAIGAECIQIFASSPRAWRFKAPAEEQAAEFKTLAAEAGIAPTFLHGIYLVNFGGPPDLLEKSVESLSLHMGAASQIGAAGVIFHSGAHKGVGFDAVLDQAAEALRQVLARSPEGPWLIIENSAGMGSHLGSSFNEIGRLLKAIDSPRAKVCLDTEHAFAAGYNLAGAEDIDSVMEEFDREIGLHNLVVVHANDARVEFGSGVDRHENIGEGHIGLAGFEVIMGHEAFGEVPFLLEVPGFEKKGPDKANLDRLRDIRNRIEQAS